jgi:hypothetical protein
LALPALAAASPAFACRAAAPKDRNAYRGAIDRMLAAWWRRDFAAFRRCFQSGGEGDFDPAAIFAAHFTQANRRRSRGDILFNGATAVAQVLTPTPADPAMGICGGMALGQLFAIDFYPGLRTPAVQSLAFVGHSVLAAGEWSAP